MRRQDCPSAMSAVLPTHHLTVIHDVKYSWEALPSALMLTRHMHLYQSPKTKEALISEPTA